MPSRKTGRKKTSTPEPPPASLTAAEGRGFGKRNMRPPPGMPTHLDVEDVVMQRQEMIARNSGAGCQGLQYDPRFINRLGLQPGDPISETNDDAARQEFYRQEKIAEETPPAIVRREPKADASARKILYLQQKGLL